MQITKEQKENLYNHYQAAIETPTGSAMTGNHWLLISVLNRLGYSVGSIEEAYEISERILFH